MTTEEQLPKKVTDVDWSDYVLAQLDQSELVDGNPTVDGLRRLTELLIGQIILSESDVIECPNADNRNTAVVTHRIEILKSNVLGRPIIFNGCAEVNYRNTDAPYHSFPIATASTRAEGRALRRALRIRKPAAEEIPKVVIDEQDVDESTKINSIQEKTISSLCSRLKIDVMKFVNMGSKEYDDIKQVDYKAAVGMLQLLNQYQQDAKKIPQGILCGV